MSSLFSQQNSSSSMSHYYALGDLLVGDDDQFVRSAYLAVLGRGVDSSGLDTYTSLLAGGKSRVEVLIELCRSLEGEAHGAVIAGLGAATSLEELLAHQDHGFVSCAYQTLLVRPVDAEALVRCVAELGRGAARLQLLREILDSGEFKSRAAMALEVERMGKRGEVNGAQSNMPADVVDSGDPPGLPGSVVELMARSDSHFVHGLYQLFLGRIADAQGLENYRERMRAGLPRRAVVRGISGSDERKSRLAMLRRIDMAIRDFHAQDRPLLGWVAALRCQRLDQMVAKRQLIALDHQLIAMQKDFQQQLARAESKMGKSGNATGMQVERKRVIKLNDLSPLARDIYFQLKNGLDERDQGDV
jgi:hypothetical protein